MTPLFGTVNRMNKERRNYSIVLRMNKSDSCLNGTIDNNTYTITTTTVIQQQIPHLSIFQQRGKYPRVATIKGADLINEVSMVNDLFMLSIAFITRLHINFSYYTISLVIIVH